MGRGLDLICPKCGHTGLFVNTEDWKPTQIKCARIKCDWKVNLKQFWPQEDKELVAPPNLNMKQLKKLTEGEKC